MFKPCTFGIEEEYLLVETATGKVLATPSPVVGNLCREVMGQYFAEEMFRCQIEVASPVFDHVRQAQQFFGDSRQRLNEALAEEGAALYCAGSHPSAQWQRQRPRTTPRYWQLFEDYQHVARRSVLSGLHVHVGVAPGCDRIQLINQVVYWLPLFLLLSSSSPLWSGENTGYMSYRRAICGEWPHMGLPEPLADWTAYQRYRGLLQRTGSLAIDGAFWWALRPSQRFATVELRISDGCPRLEDALCIAGLFRHLVECCVMPHYAPAPASRETHWIAQENYWRAMRYGRHGQFIGLEQQQAVSALVWLAQLRGQHPPDSVDAERAFMQAQRILTEGTSADRQLECLEHARLAGRDKRQGLREVVEMVVAEGQGAWPVSSLKLTQP